MRKRLIVSLLILALISAGCSTRPETETQSAATAERPVTTAEAPATVSSDTDEDLVVTTTAAVPTTELPATELPEATGTEVESTEAPVILTENSAFTRIAGPDCDDAILGVIYNAPFADGDPVPTEIWCEGEYDQLVVCPRWVGSELSAWRILHYHDEETDYERLEGPIYTSVCEEGSCVGAALDRPEGEDAWALSVKAPDGTEASFVLRYNGRYGTYAYEYLSVTDLPATEGMDPEITRDLLDAMGPDALAALLRAARRINKSPWAVIERYCSPMLDFGDSAAYTVCQGEMDGDSYRLQAARLREGYDPGAGSIAERTAAQAARYAEIGNAGGILAEGHTEGEALYFDLNGLTIFNPTLLAREVTITVNGIETGTYDLTEGDFITLLDVCAGELPADVPIQVEIKVTDSRGDPNAAILEAWPGVGGNISGAR